MADEKQQPQLNGAYYSPAIPPAEQPNHVSSHRGRRCCCCLLSILWKILVTIIILIGLIVLIFWLVVQPRPFKFHVTDAKLTEFNYTSNKLNYNLVLNFTARNPNKKLNIYYDKVVAHAYYDGVRFGTTDVITWMNSFRQYTKRTDRMSGVFSGQRVMMLDEQDEVSDFEQDKRYGVFEIDVKLYFEIRYRLGDFIANNAGTKAKAKCELMVPFGGSKALAKFVPTKCDVTY